MAIAFDAATDGGNNGGATSSLTYAHTCTGSNRAIEVHVSGDTTSDLITGVTYAGVSMTLVDKEAPAGSGNRWNYLYRLENPASGANNVVVSASGTTYILSGASSYTDFAQSGQPDNFASNATASTTNTFSSLFSPLTENSWVVLCENGFTSSPANTPPTAGTGLTRRTYDATFGAWGLFDSNGPLAVSGHTFQTNRSGNSVGITHVLASFKPAASNKTGRGLTNSKKLSRLSLVG